MKRVFLAALFAGAWSVQPWAAPLTLEEALAAAASPHPDWRVAEADLAAARADRDQAGSRQDFALYLDGAARTGRRPGGEWKPDNVARIVARKPLFDFGRSEGAVNAADREVKAREAVLVSVESLRRLDIMARFFDVLLADMQYAADNEFMAVAYVSLDHAEDRVEVGQMSRPEFLRLEAEYQDIRERRNASLQRVRAARQKLAHALNRPGQLPVELAQPKLPDNARTLPDYEALLPWVLANNPRLRALDAQIAAADARIAAIRSDNRPSLDAEVIGAGYSRESITRDEISAGLVFTVPLYQGARVDSREARERALRQRLQAEREKLQFELADALLASLQEVEWLRDTGRAAADKQIEYRDWALERARAEYELEMKTTLGTNMAETQLAQLRRKQVEYRLALALARIEALSGGRLPPSGDKP
ncbi:MAG: TolC family protein [Thiobacillus sp.]|nr:TolC family protein [Thiobacillus sp.]